MKLIFMSCVDKNITAKLDVLMPHSLLLNLDMKFKLTIPSGTYPLNVHIAIKEKVLNEYDVSQRLFLSRIERNTIA